MTKNLVIVESPTKAKTLERYLGKDYSVKASYGHIRDLPKNKMGVDTEHEFAPEYVIPENSKKNAAALKAAAKKADEIWLATDFDREGEAIAFHVAEILGLDLATAKRVTFTEITKEAVQEAFEHPRLVDMHLVEAQQTRRILDRLVGYNISPLLWKKVRPGLSAGRVQSPVLRMIVEREEAIRAFTAQEYWSVDARLTPGVEKEKEAFLGRLIQVGEEKLAASPDKKGLVLTPEAAAEHAEHLRTATYKVAEVRRKEVTRASKPPFTTSTLQQEAARKLGFSSRKTMAVAQQLYEGVELPGEGPVGLITYMRTDSTNLAEQALVEIEEVVKQQYGDDYHDRTVYKTKQKGAQEAHEAIRPSHAGHLPDGIEAHLTKDQAKLYKLIWQRAVASQMAKAIFDQVAVDIEAAAEGAPSYLLRANGQTVKFDGFRRVYFEGTDDEADEDEESRLPELTDAQLLELLEVLPEQHFTQPPPRFTEASLIKEMEALGLGRPSTYAPTISTLSDRGFVRVESRRIFPEDVGETVTNKIMKEHFEQIVDYEFTARMEEELDEIAEGRMRWTQVLDEFYGPFERLVEKKNDEIERSDVTSEPTGEKCPTCSQGDVVKKLGRYGRFLSCTRYPDCDYTANLDGEQRPEAEETDEKCPICEAPMLRKRGRFGEFLGCSKWPECKGTKSLTPPTGITCPECSQGELAAKHTRKGKVFFGCNRYPECEFAVWQRPLAEPCVDCAGLVTATAKGTKCTQCGRTTEGEVPAETAETAGAAEAGEGTG